MFELRIVALSIGCVGLITGCAGSHRPSAKTAFVQPLERVQHGGTEAQAKYELGRYYYGQRRSEQAQRALEEALALDAAHSRASNVLGVIYASQGRYDDAQTQFKRALEREPHAAHLHSNLGYAYLLQGRNADALASFEEALRLEPQSDRAGANLRIARQRLGLEESSAEVSRAGDSTAATTVVPGRSDSGGPSTLRMVEIAPNVYELTPKASPPVSSGASAIFTRVTGPTVADSGYPPYNAPSDESPTAPFGVEVSNGNGVQGMAKRMATELRSQGIGVTRLSNQRPFDQLRTEIEYRNGFLDSARRIGVRLPSRPSYVETGSLRAGISVRVVLGKDLNRNFALVVPNTPAVDKVASLR